MIYFLQGQRRPPALEYTLSPLKLPPFTTTPFHHNLSFLFQIPTDITLYYMSQSSEADSDHDPIGPWMRLPRMSVSTSQPEAETHFKRVWSKGIELARKIIESQHTLAGGLDSVYEIEYRQAINGIDKLTRELEGRGNEELLESACEGISGLSRNYLRRMAGGTVTDECLAVQMLFMDMYGLSNRNYQYTLQNLW